ncbi:carboxypeptidase-like regulatory domain-containing protein [Deferrisoma camini]|uniref:carboxypeptidase-like regulatory domain-containing protein n=1 Tax=Deferrisoma camini TaxID=1035120 RepID=UPI00046CFE29|nr:carboxypeptidase-like regulatory domain-containing protein [Deferrisoma camini]
MIRRCGSVLTGMFVLAVWSAQAAVPGLRAIGIGGNGSGGAQESGVWVSGTVRQADGSPAAGVTVRVWRPGRPAGGGGYREVQADKAGRYRVVLPEGAWRIAPCGSPAGYVPAYWDVTVEQGRVVSFLQVDRANPEIRATDPIGLAQGFRGGERIVLEGEGFGCAGRVQVELEDGREFEVTEFEEHSDGRIRFRFPEIPGADPVDGAWFSFVVGPARAGPVWVGRIERLPSPGRSREGETMETGTGLRLPATGPSVEPLPPGATGAPPGPLPVPGPGGGKKNPIQ